MKHRRAFTVLELVVVCLFASLLLVLFFLQKSNTDTMARDAQRKTAINAIYYALEEAFYPEHGYYPEEISETVLPVIDPALFTDPSGYYLNSDFSSYSYEATNCKNSQCKSYTLRAALEKESDYIKKNRN